MKFIKVLSVIAVFSLIAPAYADVKCEYDVYGFTTGQLLIIKRFSTTLQEKTVVIVKDGQACLDTVITAVKKKYTYKTGRRRASYRDEYNAVADVKIMNGPVKIDDLNKSVEKDSCLILKEEFERSGNSYIGSIAKSDC